MSLPEQVAQQIGSAGIQLRALTEPHVSELYVGGKWTRKQLLGHLIDSASNNHLRFVNASLQDEYRGPGYRQEECVQLHGYGDLPWSTLVDWWCSLNQIIVQVVQRIPEDKYSVPCFVGAYPVMTLEELIADYLVHMQHHLDQMFA